jgi:hypothetical protein
MFIGIVSKLARSKDEPSMVYYDANHVVKVVELEGEEGCMFWFYDGDVGGALPYTTPSYDAGGLIELVMQARMHPAEFMPSRNVGKKAEADEIGSTGSLKWSANEKRKPT